MNGVFLASKTNDPYLRLNIFSLIFEVFILLSQRSISILIGFLDEININNLLIHTINVVGYNKKMANR